MDLHYRAHNPPSRLLIAAVFSVVTMAVLGTALTIVRWDGQHLRMRDRKGRKVPMAAALLYGAR